MPLKTSHTKNLAYFRKLIAACETLDADYNPIAALTIPVLKLHLSNAENAVEQLNLVYTAYKNTTNAREIDFRLLRTTSTRIINTLLSSGISLKETKHARSLVSKIQ